jgi:DNA-binding transcriptional MerR regulator
MQNTLQQLDLFGFPIEPVAAPKKKEKIVKVMPAPVEEAVLPIAEPEAITITPEPALEQAAQALAEPEQEAVAPKKLTVSKIAGKRGRKSFKEMDTEADLIDVPEEEVLRQKLYYSISEVAGWFKVNTSLLRYWENEFDILQPRKTRKGDRLFRVEDIKNLQLIYFLLRQRKFSIDGAKNYLKNNKKEADTQIRLMESLSRFKSFLLEMKTNLQS